MAVPLTIRCQAIEAYERGEGSIAAVAKRFGVGAASLSRWLRLKRETGTAERRNRSVYACRSLPLEARTLLRLWMKGDSSLPPDGLLTMLSVAGYTTVTRQMLTEALEQMDGAGDRSADPSRDGDSEQ